MPTPLPTDYTRGFEAGLIEGYRAAVVARDGGAPEAVERRRKLLAWATFAVGVGGAAGALLARKDERLFTVLAVTGGLFTAIVGAALVRGGAAAGPLGLR